MHGGGLIYGRDTHETGDVEVAFFGAKFIESRQIDGRYARFLLFFAGIHLYKAREVTILFFHFFGECTGEFFTVYRFDDIK